MSLSGGSSPTRFIIGFEEGDMRFVADVGSAVDEAVSAYLRYAPAAEVLK